jgi:hypothetical protein
MENTAFDEWSAILAEMVADVATRRPHEEIMLASDIERRDLPELTGVPDICSPPSHLVAAWRNGTLAAMRSGYTLLPTDHRILPSASLDETCRRVVRAATWLGQSPHHRVIAIQEDLAGTSILALLVSVAISCNVAACKSARLSDVQAPIPAPLLHDVLSALHGRHRRTAGHTCTAWRRAACDFQLPLTVDDLRAWSAPHLAELKRAVPLYMPTATDVALVWMVTKRAVKCG